MERQAMKVVDAYFYHADGGDISEMFPVPEFGPRDVPNLKARAVEYGDGRLWKGTVHGYAVDPDTHDFEYSHICACREIDI